jgi:hypothetical protein
MWKLKPISKEGVEAALKKAEQYRLLNQPRQAESICLDVLQVEPEHQRALVLLLLAITDQFARGAEGRSVDEAREILPRLRSDYERAYYAGIICERRGKAQMASGTPGSGHIAYDWLRRAMEWYEKAEAIRPHGNDESILRWNTCARMLDRHAEIQPRFDDHRETFLE